MTGGRIIVSGAAPPPDGVEMRSIKKSEIKEFSKILEPMGLELNEDALVLEPGEIIHGRIVAECSILEGFEKISYTPMKTLLQTMPSWITILFLYRMTQIQRARYLKFPGYLAVRPHWVQKNGKRWQRQQLYARKPGLMTYF